MAFGNKITDAAQEATGTYGYVAAFSLREFYFDKPIQLQMLTTGVFSEVKTARVAIATLYGYMEDAACPDFAFGQSGEKILIFCKTSVYPFDDAVFAGFYFDRYPIPLTSVTDYLDIPPTHYNLYLAMAEKALVQERGKRNFVIEQNIIKEKVRLGLE